MNTIFIWDELDAGIKFFSLDGDLSKFDRIYINGVAANSRVRSLQNQLTKLVYDGNGNVRVRKLDEFPVDQFYGKDQTKIIVAGFLA